ncbi:MAG TPA: HlyD family efflux transporter periplasmic adaptor subunit [Planctomycetaceae bacterium]|nr:HlyD family efflux transporter periplasmic adaptor subunit [Planctomycetaceae bacterium]
MKLQYLLPWMLAAAFGEPVEKTDQPMVVESALVTVIEQAEAPAKVEGVLSTVEAREGQLVDAGKVLARIEDTEMRLAYERARIDFEIARKQATNELKVRIAKKAAEVARVELKRAVDSTDKYKKSVSETELDRLRLAAERAELDVDQAIHEQETAQLTSQLKETEMQLAEHAVARRAIVSPLAGMVVQINAHRGEWVTAGKTVLRVLKVDRLRVEGFVQAKKLTGELAGRRVTLSVPDLGGRAQTEFEGAVVFVSPEVNAVNGQTRIWAEVENKKLALRPGMHGSLTIHAQSAAGREARSR